MASGTDKNEHLYDVIKDFDTALLVTQVSGGGNHARPLAVAEIRRDGDIFFATDINSPKRLRDCGPASKT